MIGSIPCMSVLLILAGCSSAQNSNDYSVYGIDSLSIPGQYLIWITSMDGDSAVVTSSWSYPEEGPKVRIGEGYDLTLVRRSDIEVHGIRMRIGCTGLYIDGKKIIPKNCCIYEAKEIKGLNFIGP